MATKFEDLRKALTSPMVNTSTIPAEHRVFPNAEYTPEIGTPHMRYFVLRNQPSVATLGADGLDVHTGVFQISLFYPKSTGDIDLLKAADEIEAVYQQYVRGAYLSIGSVNVRITSVGLGDTSADSAWFFAPININYESYLKGVN